MPRMFSANSFFALIFMAALGPSQVMAATDSVETLELPVPKRFDLSHVQPEHYAVALGKDPARMFAFIRDQVSYETYFGCLRGPRGTLLAMAGNSVDQAALLASLLQASGQTVQFVRGKLSPADARKLVENMWVERPRVTNADDATKPPPELQGMLDTLIKGVRRDYRLIRRHLKKAGHKPNPDAAISLTALVEEAQDHWWVQWKQGDRWVNLDPSFRNAAIGSQYATTQGKPHDSLPENIFHRVEMRIKLEEYAILLQGNEAVTPKSRAILNYKAKAADLSGTDIVLSHQPENWTGPATSIQGAIASAIKETGRVKPILLLEGDKWMAGKAFYQRPPPSAGLSGVFTMISGTGTRKPVPIATAESIEFNFFYPDGRKETVVRELVDLVGKARREAGKILTSQEVRERARADDSIDVGRVAYGLFFTTGGIDDGHLADVVKVSPGAADQIVDARQILRRINIAFTATADSLLASLDSPDGKLIILFPSSPQLVITELLTTTKMGRLSLDIRRSHVRVASRNPNPNAFFARVFRGVVNGTLERIFIDYAVAEIGEASGRPPVSTSSIFEQATTKGVPTALLAGARIALEWIESEDTRARVQEELESHYLLVAPAKTIDVAGKSRLAWWRIDAQSGNTVAVTDEGLHQAPGEFFLVVHREDREVTIYARSLSGRQSIQTVAIGRLGRIIQILLRNGYRLSRVFRNVSIH